MQSTPKRESMRKRLKCQYSPWSTNSLCEPYKHKTVWRQRLASCKNVKLMLNFQQILSKTSCTWISFTAVRQHNPTRTRTASAREGEPSQHPSAHPAPVPGRGERWHPGTALRGSTAGVTRPRTSCQGFLTRPHPVHTRGCRGCPGGTRCVWPGSFLIVLLTFSCGISLQKTSLNIPTQHKFPGKWQCC